MVQRASARRAALRAAFPATVPVLTGFLCLGIAYGVLMETRGTGPCGRCS
jgi:predicted branched-subunit amino acid permease